MKRVCAWCRAEMNRVGDSRHDDGAVSHGICERCADNIAFQQGVSLQLFIDSLPLPILVMDNEGVIQSVNAKGREVFGKKPEKGVRLLSGMVFECQFARLPEGCGRTIHCSGCAIRRAISLTGETGEPQSMVPASISRKSSDIPSAIALTITTVKVGDGVLLRVDYVGGGNRRVE